LKTPTKFVRGRTGARNAILLLVCGLLAACTTPGPVPKDYTGPLAHVKDTHLAHSEKKADFFVLWKVDGKDIKTSIHSTASANSGRGLHMKPVVIGRDVPARPSRITLLAKTHYAAPILAMGGDVYRVVGEMDFDPAPNTTYIVKGTLTEDYSAIWLEEEASGTLVGQKIEVEGSAKLGFWSK
jgi:hypothetical protein